MRKGGFFKTEKTPSERIMGWCSLVSGIVVLAWLAIDANWSFSQFYYWAPVNLIGWGMIAHGLREALD